MAPTDPILTPKI